MDDARPPVHTAPGPWLMALVRWAVGWWQTVAEGQRKGRGKARGSMGTTRHRRDHGEGKSRHPQRGGTAHDHGRYARRQQRAQPEM